MFVKEGLALSCLTMNDTETDWSDCSVTGSVNFTGTDFSVAYQSSSSTVLVAIGGIAGGGIQVVAGPVSDNSIEWPAGSPVSAIYIPGGTSIGSPSIAVRGDEICVAGWAGSTTLRAVASCTKDLTAFPAHQYVGGSFSGDSRVVMILPAGSTERGLLVKTASNDLLGYKYNGPDWTEMNPWAILGGGVDGPVYASVFDSAGNLFVGGDFTYAGGVNTPYIAKYNFSTPGWEAVAPGLQKPVRALGYLSNNGSFLYAGGEDESFYSDGAAHKSSAARLVLEVAGAKWSSYLGEDSLGLNVSVLSLAPTTNALYIGTPDGVYQCNPTCAPFATPTTGGTINTVAENEGRIVVGGDFSSLNECAVCSNLAINENGNWDAPPYAPTSPVLSVAYAGGNLYAGLSAGLLNTNTNSLITTPSITSLAVDSGGSTLYAVGPQVAFSVNASTGSVLGSICSGATNLSTVSVQGNTVYAGSDSADGLHVNSCTPLMASNVTGVSAVPDNSNGAHMLYHETVGDASTLFYRKYESESGTLGSPVPINQWDLITNSAISLGLDGTVFAIFSAGRSVKYKQGPDFFKTPGILGSSSDGSNIYSFQAEPHPLGLPIVAWTGSATGPKPIESDVIPEQIGTDPTATPTITATPEATRTPGGGVWTPAATPTPSYAIVGRIVDADSRPVSNAGVELILNGSTRRSAVTGLDGIYRFRTLPDGSAYRITPRLDGYTFSPASAEGRIAAGDIAQPFSATNVTYDVTIAVLSAGKPLPGVAVYRGLTEVGTTNERGTVTLSKVGINSQFRVAAMLGGYEMTPPFRDVEVTTGPVAVEFTASRSASYYSISGKVKIKGEPLEGVVIDGGDLKSTRTKADGSYSFDRVKSGTAYTLIPAFDGFTFSPEGVTGVLSGNIRLNFEGKASNVLGDDVKRLSLSSAGKQGNGASGDLETGASATSSTGRYTVFSSQASNLVYDDTNGVSDVFIRDNNDYTTARISVNADGQQGNAASGVPGDSEPAVSMSSAGKKAAFSSVASNLVSDDWNEASDIFVYDTSDKSQTLASKSSDGIYGDGASYSPFISPDGTKVAFVSEAQNLVEGDTNGAADVFVRDLSAGTTQRASLTSEGAEANAACSSPSLNQEGSLVTFSSRASNLSSGESGNIRNIFVRDIPAGVTSRISKTAEGGEPDADSINPAISANGKVIVFASRASNLVSGDTNGKQDVFVYDRETGATSLVSRNSDGTLGNQDSGIGQLSISADGKIISFASEASNLDANDTKNKRNIFVHDRATHRTGLMSKRASGTIGNAESGGPALSGDGKYVSFTSSSTNLVDGDTNHADDVFLAKIGPLPAVLEGTPKITIPPTLVTKKDDVTIVMQLFTLGRGARFFLMPALSSGQSGAEILAAKKKISYVVKVKSGKRDTQQYTAKRNVLTIKNLKPGRYTVSYHAQVKQGSKVVAKTKESPKRKLTIVG